MEVEITAASAPTDSVAAVEGQPEDFIFDKYEKDVPIPAGYCSGTITGLKNLGKRVTRKWGEKEEIALVVTLDLPDSPTVDIKYNRTVGRKSNLREMLTKLGFPPTGERFDLRSIVGTKVDVWVKNVHDVAVVDWQEIDLPNRRRQRTVPVPIPCGVMSFDGPKPVFTPCEPTPKRSQSQSASQSASQSQSSAYGRGVEYRSPAMKDGEEI